jgi:hypothetical protein
MDADRTVGSFIDCIGEKNVASVGLLLNLDTRPDSLLLKRFDVAVDADVVDGVEPTLSSSVEHDPTAFNSVLRDLSSPSSCTET